MKKYLLPESGQFYKANLHCHTTCSDGELTPAETKALYQQHGYSVIAFTDHNVYLAHPELTDENFVALNGFENNASEEQPGAFGERKTCHMCFVSLDENNMMHPFWHRSKYLFGNAPKYRDQVQFDESKPDYERVYTPECINDMARLGQENNFFVTYNHPRWSMEEYNNYIAYENIDAMEICNYACVVAGYWDYNGEVYDEMLRAGKRIFCVSTDDNHGVEDACGGYTMIKADRLTYQDIAASLKAGNFYASTGPEIHDLWVEEGKVHITCSPASKIILSTGIRHQGIVDAKREKVESVTEATFELNENFGYFRITVLDKEGNAADTNAYFMDSL